MTKIDIISGFLGAGKTTLIKKLIGEVFAGQKIVLIENEFGEIGIDGGFLKDAGINITEMNSGCICCSLVGDFGESLNQVMEQFHPDRIIIEPSGVGKLSDVRIAVENANKEHDMVVNSLTTVADAKKVKMYMKNFGEFYNNQVESAGTVVLSRTQDVSAEKLDEVVAMLREKNPTASVITTPWEEISGAQILAAMEKSVDLAAELMEEVEEHHHHHHHEDGEECTCGHHHHHDHDDEDEHEHEHHHHHHDHDEECCCEDHDHEHHHHDHDEDEHHHHDHEEHEHHHHHHEDGEECTCGHDHDHEHEHHHHEDGEECSCGHHHHHHHGHDADEVFTSWGIETPRKYTKDELESMLNALDDSETYGMILRAKGMVPSENGTWIYFDMVPGEHELRDGQPDVTGRFCVIGSKLNEENLAKLFKI